MANITMWVRDGRLVLAVEFTEPRVQAEQEPRETEALGITWLNGQVYRCTSWEQTESVMVTYGILPYVPLTEEEYIAQHVTPYL